MLKQVNKHKRKELTLLALAKKIYLHYCSMATPWRPNKNKENKTVENKCQIKLKYG